MPFGGYCEVCGRWVWVGPDGRCELGHSAGRVREVQQLMPLASPGGAPLRTPVRPRVTPHRMRFWWRHSAWILLTLTGGPLSWLAFVYVGLRARRPWWLVLGFVYLLPTAATIAAIGSPYLSYAIAVQVVVAVVSFVHAVTLRPTYRALMFGDPPLGSVPAPPRMVTQARQPELPRDLDHNVTQTLREAYRRVDEMNAVVDRIAKPETRRAVARLCVTAQQILAEIQKRPGRIEVARGFLTYYLDAATRIVNGYEQLLTRGSSSPDVLRTMAQAEASLPGIQRAFEGQLESLLQLELLDLDSEIALLDKTVQMEERFHLGATSPGTEAVPTPSAGSPPATGPDPALTQPARNVK